MNHKHEALWLLKKCNLYVLHVHWFYPISLHLTIRSRLILTQNELWISNCFHANSKFFSYVEDSQRTPLGPNLLKCTKILSQHHAFPFFLLFRYTSFFWVKSGSCWMSFDQLRDWTPISKKTLPILNWLLVFIFRFKVCNECFKIKEEKKSLHL